MLSRSWATGVIGTVGLISLLALIWVIRRMMTSEGDSAEGFDLAFSLAAIMSVVLSFHILGHDLVLLGLPFAIVVDRIVASRAVRNPRFAGPLILISLFYVYEFYLLLFAWSRVYWLGGVLIVLAVLVSMELTEGCAANTSR